MCMGFRDAKPIGSALTGHEVGFRIQDNYYPQRVVNGRSGHNDNPYPHFVKWNIGDRVRLDFDCKGRRCSAYLNDQLLGTLTEDLPKRFYLAISACFVKTAFETTFF